MRYNQRVNIPICYTLSRLQSNSVCTGTLQIVVHANVYAVDALYATFTVHRENVAKMVTFSITILYAILFQFYCQQIECFYC